MAVPENQKLKYSSLKLREHKTDRLLNLTVSKSRTFLFPSKIKRVFTADPGIAEPIVIAEDQMVFLGKAPGKTDMFIWDINGRSSSIEINVRKPRTFQLRLASILRIHYGYDDKNVANSMYSILFADSREIEEACAMSKNYQKSKLRRDMEFKERQKLRSQKPLEYADSLPSSYSEYKRELRRLMQKVVVKTAHQFSEPTAIVSIPISQSCVFTSDDKINRIVSNGNKRVEPIAFSDNDFALIGKSKGKTILEVQRSSGIPLTISINVIKSKQKKHSTLSASTSGSLKLQELSTSQILHVKAKRPLLIRLKNRVVRTSIADPGIAEPFVLNPNDIVIVGKRIGTTTFNIWDDKGNADSLEFRILGMNKKWQKEMNAAHDEATSEMKNQDNSSEAKPQPVANYSLRNKLHEIVIWSGKQMDILSVPKS